MAAVPTRKKHGNRGAPFGIPSSAGCSRENLNPAFISDEHLAQKKKKKIMYTSHLTSKQTTGKSVEFTSPDGGLGSSQQHATLHHKSLSC